MSDFFVLYDHQAFDMQRFGGISRYFCEIIGRLRLRSMVSVRFSINYYLTTSHAVRRLVPIPRCIYKRYRQYFEKRNRNIAIHALKSKKNYVFHPTYYDSYFLEHMNRSLPYVVTVHDMIHEKFSSFFPDAEDVIAQKRKVITGASRIIAISEQTKKDVVELLHIDPRKIDVVYHGTGMKPFEGRFRLKLPEKFLLFVGDRSLYKNFDRFMQAFAMLRKEDPELFVVCTGTKLRADEREKLSEWGVLEATMHVKASDRSLCELYARARAFVYPSLYEGFGIPLLEAYACHCPVVLSNASCFPEIAGEAGVYFDPYSEESMYDAIRSVINDERKRQELIEAGTKRLSLYSWEKAAKETEAVYLKTWNENR